MLNLYEVSGLQAIPVDRQYIRLLKHLVDVRLSSLSIPNNVSKAQDTPGFSKVTD